ncbi:hypothetical protein D3C72_2367110 [compost metagenome]
MLHSLSALAKKNHGNSPVNTTSEYGTFPDARFATLPNTKVNTSMVRNGRIRTQLVPTTVCL